MQLRIALKMCCALLVLLVLCVSPVMALDRVPSRDDILKTLHTGHPRLLATAEDFAALKQRIVNDPLLQKWHDNLLKQADALANRPAITMSIKSTPTRSVLQGTSQLRQHMYLLGMLYQLHKDPKYAQLAWRDMQVAIDMPDWYPRHFLGVAETSRALAIGYDWMYDALTPEQRKAVEDAILEKAFKYAIATYQGKYMYGWWPAVNDNWNQVCNGGMGMAALAIGDVHPKEAGEVLTNIVRLLPIAMHEYAPDGAWPEGIAYWGYGGGYNVQIIASLISALGTDFGLADMPGYSQTAWFPILLTGPTGLAFNYGDSPAITRSNTSDMLWFAKRFGQPFFAKHYLPHASGNVLDLLWYDASLLSPEAQQQAPQLPNDHRFGKVDVFTFTNDLTDPNATWLAFKAGNNAFNHSHLDLGSFVLDALGERFVVDLGSDSYDLPSYFSKERWNYFRTRAESHNTLQINPSKKPGQDVKAVAKVTDFHIKNYGAGAQATIDLTAAYSQQTPAPSRVMRTFIRLGTTITIGDTIRPAARATTIRWHLYTPAQVELVADGAILTIKNKQLKVHILLPADGRFELSDAKPLETSPIRAGQNPNKGISRLSLVLKTNSNGLPANIRVMFEPVTTIKSP